MAKHIPDNGGAAFPRPTSVDHTSGDLTDGNRQVEEQQGMSLRDWFAGQALSGLIAAGSVPMPYQEGFEKGPTKAAQLAYIMADAMIQSRRPETFHPAEEAQLIQICNICGAPGAALDLSDKQQRCPRCYFRHHPDANPGQPTVATKTKNTVTIRQNYGNYPVVTRVFAYDPDQSRAFVLLKYQDGSQGIAELAEREMEALEADFNTFAELATELTKRAEFILR